MSLPSSFVHQRWCQNSLLSWPSSRDEASQSSTAIHSLYRQRALCVHLFNQLNHGSRFLKLHRHKKLRLGGLKTPGPIPAPKFHNAPETLVQMADAGKFRCQTPLLVLYISKKQSSETRQQWSVSTAAKPSRTGCS